MVFAQTQNNKEFQEKSLTHKNSSENMSVCHTVPEGTESER